MQGTECRTALAFAWPFAITAATPALKSAGENDGCAIEVEQAVLCLRLNDNEERRAAVRYLMNAEENWGTIGGDERPDVSQSYECAENLRVRVRVKGGVSNFRQVLRLSYLEMLM